MNRAIITVLLFIALLASQTIIARQDAASLREQNKAQAALIKAQAANIQDKTRIIDEQNRELFNLRGVVRDQQQTLEHFFIGRQTEQPSRGPARPMVMEVTAYTADDWPDNPAYGIAANGHRLSDVDAWRVAAADPRYYPPGCRLYVAGVGVVTVKDTGSDVKGPNRLDIFVGMKDRVRAFEYGRRQVPVVMLR